MTKGNPIILRTRSWGISFNPVIVEFHKKLGTPLGSPFSLKKKGLPKYFQEPDNDRDLPLHRGVPVTIHRRQSILTRWSYRTSVLHQSHNTRYTADPLLTEGFHPSPRRWSPVPISVLVVPWFKGKNGHTSGIQSLKFFSDGGLGRTKNCKELLNVL